MTTPATGQPNLTNVINAISTDRFGTYLNARAGEPIKALALYEWNSELCAAFYEPLQIVEVALRNAFHRELQVTFGADWPFLPSFLGLDLGVHTTIKKAKEQVASSGKAIDTPHVVAALSFGFWTTLLMKKFEQIFWLPADLHRAFPDYYAAKGSNISRPVAAQRFDEIRHFRNRVFHHEPLFHRRSLHSDYKLLIEAASWMSSDLAVWAGNRTIDCLTKVNAGPPQP